FVFAVVRQRSLHTDGADILAKRRQAGRHGGELHITGIDHVTSRLFHESRKCVLAAHGAEHPAVRVTSWIAARQAWIEVAEALGLSGAYCELHASCRGESLAAAAWL